MDHARAALARLAGAAPATDAARAASEEIERAWRREPLTAVLAGDQVAARSAFLNHLVGGVLFDPARPAPVELVVVLRCGEATRIRVVMRDGREKHLVPREVPVAAVAPGSAAGAGPEELVTAVALVEAAEVEVQAPAAPPRRSLWRRLWAFFARLFGRRAAPAPAPSLTLAPAQGASPAAQRIAAPAAIATPAAIAAPAPPPPRAAAATPPRSPLDGLAVSLRPLLDESGAGAGVDRIIVEIDSRHLPAGVEVVELPSAAGRDRLPDQVDGFLLVARSLLALGAARRRLMPATHAPPPHVLVVTAGNDSAAGRAVDPEREPRDRSLRHVGRFTDAAPRLRWLLLVERALRLARFAGQALKLGQSAIGETLDQAEAGFEARLAELRARQIADPGAFLNQALERVAPLITERVHVLIQQWTADLAGQIERAGPGWVAEVAQAAGADQLRAAAPRIEQEMAAQVARVHEDAQHLVAGGLGGGAHDLFRELCRDLRRISPEMGDEEPPTPAAVDIAAALTGDLDELKLGPVASRLTSLFRSIDTLRAELVQRIEDRVGRLRNLVVAQVLDAEPALRASLVEALRTGFGLAMVRHANWLEKALAEENEAIARERAALAPLGKIRDAAAADQTRLEELMARTEDDVFG